MLIGIDRILNEAKKGRYGVAAPDAYNSPSVQGCFQAALHLKAPLIISCLGTTNMEETAEVVKYYAKKHPEAVVALHLDHGGPFEEIMRALRCGYSSVMIDRSKLVFEENMREVREVVKIAHAMGVTVEAELGHVGTGTEYEATCDSGLTHREEAKRFVEETGVDALAVAVGTSHGVYKGTPRLEFELLRDIAGLVSVPLVLHGGSGTGDENLKNVSNAAFKKSICLRTWQTPLERQWHALCTANPAAILISQRLWKCTQGKRKTLTLYPWWAQRSIGENWSTTFSCLVRTRHGILCRRRDPSLRETRTFPPLWR